MAVILFRRAGQVVPPLPLNLAKNALALPLFVVTMLVLNIPFHWPDAGGRGILLLVVSGFIGIGLADTLFLMTINRVGAGLQAIINTTYSPVIIALSLVFLSEELTKWQLLGAACIVGAVAAVTWTKSAAPDLPRKQLVAGVACGVLASLTQGISIVMIKPLLNETPMLWVNFWRLSAGVISTLALTMFLPGQRAGLHLVWDPRVRKIVLSATLIGTYFAMMFWLGGMKFTQASTASALNQTASLWTFLLAAVVLKEPVTKWRVVGLMGGMAGVFLVTLG